MNISAFIVSLRLAACTTLIVLALAIPLSGWLVLSRSRARPIVDALVTLPLLLPPTVMGFYILQAFSPSSWLGNAVAALLGRALPFSFTGLLVASVIINMPFAVKPIVAAFVAVPKNLVESARLLGDSRSRTLRRILLPLSLPGVLAGAVLVAVHSLGEFGVALMMGGSIPNETQTISIDLYQRVQSMEYRAAHISAAILVGISLVALVIVSRFGVRSQDRHARVR